MPKAQCPMPNAQCAMPNSTAEGNKKVKMKKNSSNFNVILIKMNNNIYYYVRSIALNAVE
ncbi:MAG: hypothetical protein F6J93_06970 [Oscillatoria sp. SIO1A7]|nr:hypothetical protein [Oscillatoria sp. SIO1A7]